MVDLNNSMARDAGARLSIRLLISLKASNGVLVLRNGVLKTSTLLWRVQSDRTKSEEEERGKEDVGLARSAQLPS